jgi:hypothetical protein
MRPLLFVTLLFLALLSTLTVFDVANNGVTPLDVVSALIIVFFALGIVNALRAPRE